MGPPTTLLLVVPTKATAVTEPSTVLEVAEKVTRAACPTFTFAASASATFVVT